MAKMTVSENMYTVTRKRPFDGAPVSDPQIESALGFAYEMVYGEEGWHRSRRTGGELVRDNLEKFANTFQGKLAEICLHDRLEAEGIVVSDLDFGIYGEGKWDDCDLLANGKRLNVKSVAHFANLLLLESGDWDESGLYIPDRDKGKDAHYDSFVLVRIKPDIKTLIDNHEHLYETAQEADAQEPQGIDVLGEVICAERWSYDIAGCISHRRFLKGIDEDQEIPKGAKLNGRITMDASNYYFQAGDLVPGHILIQKLREIGE